MDKRAITSFAKILSNYFFEYLPVQRGLSEHTIRSYRDAISQLLEFCEEKRHIRREQLELADFSRELIEAFLLWLEQEKGCSAATRNQRRIAINAFFKYLQYEDPAYILLCQQIRTIPKKKYAQKTILHMPVEAIQMILSQPDRTTRAGRRDFAFLTLMYESAARASEIAGLAVADVHFDRKGAIVHLRGKGKKVRDVPIISEPAAILKSYLAEEAQYRPCDAASSLFCNRSKGSLTRGGVYYIVKKYVDLARKETPELFPAQVHPHVFRHSRAMHWLEAGVDLQYIKDLLGHTELTTTEVYAKLNIKMKQKILEEVHPQRQGDQHVSWTEDKNLMMWLDGLRIPSN